MAQRDMDTVFGAKEEWLSFTTAALKELDTAILTVIDSFALAVKQSEGLNAAVGAVGKTAEEMARKEAQTAGEKEKQYITNEKTIATLAFTYEKLGATKEELLAIDVREFERQGATIEQAERYKKILKDTQEIKEGVGPAFAEFYRQNLTEAVLQNKMYEESLQSLGAVQSSVYQGMEGQLAKFIETGRFSVGAMAKIVAQQVKTELVGLAAKSAVWAIYELAMGLRDAAMGLPTAALHFASAKQFAIVGGAAMAAAAGANAALGGMSEKSSGSTASPGSKAQPLLLTAAAEPNPTQNITIQVYNPLSQQNWAEIAENNIIPALKDASGRNVVMNVRTMEA